MKKLRERVVVTLALALCIAFVLPGLCASAENIGTYPVGEEMGWITFYESRLPIINCVLNSGYLPSNVEMYWDENGVYLTGVPETMGSFVAEYYVFTDEGVSPAYVSFTVGAEATPVPNQNIVITKSPTGEHVEVGGTAKFVARAQNAERIVWRIVSNDTTNTVKAADGPQYFPGLQVSGLDSATLVLGNIPQSMDGWRVEAQFWNGNKHAESYGAEITIVDGNGVPVRQVATPTPAPIITPAPTFVPPSLSGNDLPVDSEARTANIMIQPQGVELLPGENYTLSVIATSPNNGTLSYQWYSAATNNRSAALPISGASDASYTINQTDGTAYYWVAGRSPSSCPQRPRPFPRPRPRLRPRRAPQRPPTSASSSCCSALSACLRSSRSSAL